MTDSHNQTRYLSTFIITQNSDLIKTTIGHFLAIPRKKFENKLFYRTKTNICF